MLSLLFFQYIITDNTGVPSGLLYDPVLFDNKIIFIVENTTLSNANSTVDFCCGGDVLSYMTNLVCSKQN